MKGTSRSRIISTSRCLSSDETPCLLAITEGPRVCNPCRIMASGTHRLICSKRRKRGTNTVVSQQLDIRKTLWIFNHFASSNATIPPNECPTKHVFRSLFRLTARATPRDRGPLGTRLNEIIPADMLSRYGPFKKLGAHRLA